MSKLLIAALVLTIASSAAMVEPREAPWYMEEEPEITMTPPPSDKTVEISCTVHYVTVQTTVDGQVVETWYTPKTTCSCGESTCEGATEPNGNMVIVLISDNTADCDNIINDQ